MANELASNSEHQPAPWMVQPPDDWSDTDGWDTYLRARAPETPENASSIDGLRFASFALATGGRVWFPGCGVDACPSLFAVLGCDAVATDISPFAIEWQARQARQAAAERVSDWLEFLESGELTPTKKGRFEARREDFLVRAPRGTFDVVINRRALPQLTRCEQARAARNFAAALRPGGVAIIDTLNTSGDERNTLEDSLLGAGFYVPWHKSERWYRDQLAATNILYMMCLGRPIIPHWQQYPPEDFERRKREDKAILDSFRAEYEARSEREAAEANKWIEDATTKIAHVFYSTG